MPHHVPHFHLRRWSICLLLTVLLAGVVSPSLTLAAPVEIPAIVATVQDQQISAEELTAALRSELLRLDMERYQIMKQKLDELIAARLMQLEATKRGVSLQQLNQEEIVAKTPKVTSEQVKTFYEANKNRIRQPLDTIAPRLEAYLQNQARQKQQQTFLHELRQHYSVTTALPVFTVDVDADDDPFQGPEQAPVTIIEFSDFQCPYCRRAQSTLKRLLHDYEGKIKLVYRDFPLRNIHPQAQKAAEAAQCAAAQGQFWPYHDRLFETSRLQVQDLKQHAKELGLDEQQFNTCLDSGKYASEVEGDLQDGMNAGVHATPSFFINGQPVSGAVGYDRFKALVDEALQQAKSSQRANP
jgi:protein-disulfide isomerase